MKLYKFSVSTDKKIRKITVYLQWKINFKNDWLFWSLFKSNFLSWDYKNFLVFFFSHIKFKFFDSQFSNKYLSFMLEHKDSEENEDQEQKYIDNFFSKRVFLMLLSLKFIKRLLFIDVNSPVLHFNKSFLYFSQSYLTKILDEWPNLEAIYKWYWENV